MWSLLAAAVLGAPIALAQGFSAPTARSVVTAGAVVEVRWTPTRRDAADEAELVLSLDGGATFGVRVSSELSPDATSYRWRVPALPSARARLGVRSGRSGRDDEERIVLVSDEFTIAGAGPDAAALSRGLSESWTEQALHERTVRDLLDESVRAASERIVRPDADNDVEEVPPALALAAPRPGSVLACSAKTAPVPRRGALDPDPFAPTPLRL